MWTSAMDALRDGIRGLSLIVGLSWDRLVYAGALGAALGMGAWLFAAHIGSF